MQGWSHHRQVNAPRPRPKPADLAEESFPCSFECLERKRKPSLAGKATSLAAQPTTQQHQQGGIYVG